MPSARKPARAKKSSAASELVAISRALCRGVDALSFGAPVAFVYNPLDYARAPHELYLTKYGGRGAKILLLGMNPGPFGMAQTGVPFGEIELAKNWLGVAAPVRAPKHQHEKRPITGFDTTRSEVSGARLWGWAKSRFGTPEAFFDRFFVVNYCPLVFMEASGRNYTPDKLKKHERAALEAECDDALKRIVRCMAPTHLIGIGAFAYGVAQRVVGDTSVTISKAHHPSPASPIANRGWEPLMDAHLEEQGIALGRG